MNASTRTGPSPVMIPSPSGVAPAGMRSGAVRSVMASLYPVALAVPSSQASGSLAGRRLVSWTRERTRSLLKTDRRWVPTALPDTLSCAAVHLNR